MVQLELKTDFQAQNEHKLQRNVCNISINVMILLKFLHKICGFDSCLELVGLEVCNLGFEIVWT